MSPRVVAEGRAPAIGVGDGDAGGLGLRGGEAIERVVPGMIVRERWCRGSEGEVAWMLAGIHRREKKELTGKSKVSASGTGAGDSLVSDAVRGGSLAGRPSTPMG